MIQLVRKLAIVPKQPSEGGMSQNNSCQQGLGMGTVGNFIGVRRKGKNGKN
jgi:hypothetical protein